MDKVRHAFSHKISLLSYSPGLLPVSDLIADFPWSSQEIYPKLYSGTSRKEHGATKGIWPFL